MVITPQVSCQVMLSYIYDNMLFKAIHVWKFVSHSCLPYTGFLVESLVNPLGHQRQ